MNVYKYHKHTCYLKRKYMELLSIVIKDEYFQSIAFYYNLHYLGLAVPEFLSRPQLCADDSM